MTSAPHLHDTGEGPALLLLHAFPQDASMWDQQVAAWSGRYRCLRPDVWGCGASPPPPAEPSLQAYAAAVVDALEGVGVTRFAVMGLSMGGYTAMALLRQFADRVTALVLVSTHANADSDEQRRTRLAMAEEVRTHGVDAILDRLPAGLLSPAAREEPHILDPCIGRLLRCTAEGVAACQEMMAARPASHEVMAAVRVPALVVHGSEDTVSPPAVVMALADSIPGARRVELEGCGHLCNVERPHRFSAVVGQFLDAAR